MILPSIILTLTLVGTVQTLTWDCYDQKCEGDGFFSETYIYCDNSKYRCSVNRHTGKNLIINSSLISTVERDGKILCCIVNTAMYQKSFCH